MAMSAMTKQYLTERSLYPACERDKTPLEELITLSNKIKLEKDAEYERVIKEYDMTGVYAEDKLNTLKEVLDYLHYGIKRRYRDDTRNCSTKIFGPTPK